MSFILGTAGHVDHGKTSLVYALTGTDCDRLEEEKVRGITIELGFAQLQLTNGKTISIIDVPGHEKFVKQMVAGIVGMRAVLLVISAEEGIMPQTREHLDIITLLGVQQCIVVITKIDVVDAEWLAIVREEIEELLETTCYKESPYILFSAKTGEGKEELLTCLSQLQEKSTAHYNTLPFRMAIDRVFSMKGHGTIVTGSALSGSVTEESTLMLYPRKQVVRIKHIESHNQEQHVSVAGSRTALNIHNLHVKEIQRGEVIALANTLEPALCWEIYISCLPHSPLPIKHMGEIHFHHQTKEVLAKVYCLQKKNIEPGEQMLCHLMFKEPMVGIAYDRGVIRSCSPLRVIAGCIVLNPLPDKCAMLHKRSSHEEYNTLMECIREYQREQRDISSSQLYDDYIQRTLLIRISMAKESGLSIRELMLLTNRSYEEIERRLAYALEKNEVIAIQEKTVRYIAYSIYEHYVGVIQQYIEEESEKSGLSNRCSLAKLYMNHSSHIVPACIDNILERLVKEKYIYKDADTITLLNKKVCLTQKQEEMISTLIEYYRQAHLTPPHVNEVATHYSTSQQEVLALLYYLQEQSLLVHIGDGFWTLHEEIDTLLTRLRAFFVENEHLGLADFKRIVGGISRKYI
ncbi:MAG: selenocysteine-specific translation elongation factor, partial [Desulfovibrionaceae bacterium]|nr:selenocysteine-specific translation elongation factor [Desulfovibrionaceae bacterium]